jgi:hypothetical protein
MLATIMHAMVALPEYKSRLVVEDVRSGLPTVISQDERLQLPDEFVALSVGKSQQAKSSNQDVRLDKEAACR